MFCDENKASIVSEQALPAGPVGQEERYTDFQEGMSVSFAMRRPIKIELFQVADDVVVILFIHRAFLQLKKRSQNLVLSDALVVQSQGLRV